MGKIEDEVTWPDVDILFAPHHGRDSGKVSTSILEAMAPKIVVLGQAPPQNLNYYRDYVTITLSSAGSIYFECEAGWVHIYVGSSSYTVDFLGDKGADTNENYIGFLAV